MLKEEDQMLDAGLQWDSGSTWYSEYLVPGMSSNLIGLPLVAVTYVLGYMVGKTVLGQVIALLVMW